MRAAGLTLPNLVLPTLTVSYARGANTIGAFGLVTRRLTILYHARDLGLNLPYKTFTNHYHREEGDTHRLRLIG